VAMPVLPRVVERIFCTSRSASRNIAVPLCEVHSRAAGATIDYMAPREPGGKRT
jgi:hypothetical protein